LTGERVRAEKLLIIRERNWILPGERGLSISERIFDENESL
jgi:hypothetical protein